MPLELDVRARRGEAARSEVDRVGVKGIGDRRFQRYRFGGQRVVERTPQLAEALARLDALERQPHRHQLGAGRRIDVQLAVAAMKRVLAERPLEQIASRRAAREADAFQLQEISERRKVDV